MEVIAIAVVGLLLYATFPQQTGQTAVGDGQWRVFCSLTFGGRFLEQGDRSRKHRPL